MDDYELSFEAKTAINIRFQELYDAAMRRGVHGHSESIFGSMHEAYSDYLNGRLQPLPTLDRDALEAIRFKPRPN